MGPAYGTGGDRYPLAPGEVWGVGRHRFAVGDLVAGDGDRLLAFCNTFPDLTYCDPPWNAAIFSAFYHRAGLANPRAPFPAFLEALVNTVARTRGPVFLESGLRLLPFLHTIIRGRGGSVLQTWPIVYNRTRPATLVLATWAPAYAACHQAPDFTGQDDLVTPRLALEAIPGTVVYDPCIGQGLTAEAAEKTGKTCVGLELHPRRLANTLVKLVALTGLEPVLLGSLDYSPAIVKEN